MYNEITFFLFWLSKEFQWRYGLHFFLKIPANFSPSPGSGKNRPKRPEASGKFKNVNFNKLAKNSDGAKRKWYPSLLALCLILFKLVSMDAE